MKHIDLGMGEEEGGEGMGGRGAKGSKGMGRGIGNTGNGEWGR